MPDSPVVLVTGCTEGGIGYALCESFRQRGCCVYATARRPETMAGLQEQGIRTLQLDVTSTAEIRSVIQHIQQQSGRLDIVVNNAGTWSAGG
jgi:NAD(P)-dependent dehydrogenase (short-subunit alcohol dehydrogenase family)